MSDREFRLFQDLIFKMAGITISDAKKALVCGRLTKRVKTRMMTSFDAYFRLLHQPGEAAEMQSAVDALTTNETYFFREQRHFEMLEAEARNAHVPRPTHRDHTFRVWSAASSSGEEAYSIAMTLDRTMKSDAWHVIASDISQRVLQQARAGQYPDERGTHIPDDLRRRYCRKGTGDATGTFLVERTLRDKIDFSQINLNVPLPSIGLFDVVFLRNVMIYFSAETRRQVIERIAGVLRPGGYLYIGLSESLNGISDAVAPVAPSIYVKR